MSTTLPFRLLRQPNISSLTISDCQEFQFRVLCKFWCFSAAHQLFGSWVRFWRTFIFFQFFVFVNLIFIWHPFRFLGFAEDISNFGYFSTNCHLNSPPSWWNLGPMGIVNIKRSWFRLSCSLYRYVMMISPFFLHLLYFKVWDIPKVILLLGIGIRMSQTKMIPRIVAPDGRLEFWAEWT